MEKVDTDWIIQQRERGQALLNAVHDARANFARAERLLAETEAAWGTWLWDITLRAAQDGDA